MTSSALTVRTISAAEHLAYIRALTEAEGGSASFLQTPGVGRGQAGVEGRVDRLVLDDDGARRRRARALPPAAPGQALPRLPARGPAHRLGHREPPRLAGPDGSPPAQPGRLRHPDRAAGGHQPMERRPGQGGHRRRVRLLADRAAAHRAQPGTAPASVSQLHELGWQPQTVEGGFAAGQPQYNFWIPLRDAEGNPRTEDDVLKGMNQQWRRNIKKATKAGVEVDRQRSAGGDRAQGLPRPLRPDRRPRPLHAATAELLRDDVRGAGRRGAGPDPALPRPPRGRPGRGHHLDPRGSAHVVLLRRLLDREARRPRVQRRAVADDPRLPGRRRARLRPARDHLDPGRRRLPRRADPVQGRHRRRGRGVRRRVGPAR